MYTTTQPLTEAQLRHYAPSIFATGAHGAVSERYQFIATTALIDGLADEGWLPVYAAETRVRRPDKHGFAKHLLRFRRLDEAFPMVGDSFPEIVLVNSHDRSCAYRLHAGLFRLVCSNGMIIADADMGQVRRRHSGDAVDDVIEGTYAIVESLPRIAHQVAEFSAIALAPREQEAFAEAARALRWDQGAAPVTPAQLIQARRPEDDKDDLWTTYQRIQENLFKGGLQGRARSGRRTTTRAIQSVDANVSLNKALWLLTERLAELKGA